MVVWFTWGEPGFLCLNSANTDENLGMLYKGGLYWNVYWSYESKGMV